MKKTVHFILLSVLLFQVAENTTIAQPPNYPDMDWQARKPQEVKMNAQFLDSAVGFALGNDSKTDYDLRIANMKAYADEPNYRIQGPMKKRGKPAGSSLQHLANS